LIFKERKDMSSFIIKYRWLIISICSIAGIVFIFLIPFARTDPEIRNYIPSTLPSKVRTDSIENEFGCQDMIVLLYSDSNTVFTKENLVRIKELEGQLLQISGISSVISPFNMKTIRNEDGMMVAERLVSRIPENQNDINELKSKIDANTYLHEVVFSSDLNTAAITMTLSDKTAETVILREIDSVINASGAGSKVMTGGLPVIRRYIMKDVNRDVMVIIPAALLIMVLILRITLGSWRSVYIPFTVIIISTGVSMGLIPLLGWKISIISLLVPVILIAVANNYGIYLVNYYKRLVYENNGSRSEILGKVMDSLKVPILFSGLTTIAGVMGLLTHSIIPARQVGILASAGVALALLLSLFMVPALLTVNKTSELSGRFDRKVNQNMSDFFKRISKLIVNHPGKVLIVSMGIIMIFASGILLIRVDANQEHFFPASHPLRKASDIINSRFGGSQTISVMVSGDIKDPDVMSGIDRLTSRITSVNGVGRVFSISQAVREMSKALYNKDEKGYDRIPESREAIAQMFELYYMSGDAEDFKQLLNTDNSKAHIIIRLSDPSMEVINQVSAIIEKEGKEIPAKLTTGGYALIMSDFTGSLIRGQVFSLIFALIAVFILLVIIFRSLKGGLTGSIPLAASIVILFGFMGFSNIAIDPATALLSSVMIGVGVDFTIQYLWKFNLEFSKIRDYNKATEKSMTSIGQSIVINALTVMAGFSALIFSGFISIKFFGYLVVISIAACLAGSLFVVPAFIVKYHPRFIEKNLHIKQYINDEDKANVIPVSSTISKGFGPAA